MTTRRADSLAIVARARKIGWPVSQTSEGSWKIMCEDGVMVPVHMTYSDVRSIKNLEAELNKHGFERAEADFAAIEIAERKLKIEADRTKSDAAAKKAAAQRKALVRAAGPYAPAAPSLDEILAKHPAPRTWEHVQITPAMAHAISERNDPRNRPLKAAWVREWVEVIRGGRWLYTHQGIAMNTEGLIQDGQHRVAAIEESGITVEMQVSVGMPDENFKILDSGHNRTAASVLAMGGMRQATAVAAMCRLLYLYDVWGRNLLEHTGGRVSNSAVVSMQESLDPFLAGEAVAVAYRLRKEVGGGVGGTAAAFYLLFAAVGVEKSMTYIDAVIRGVGGDRDPTYIVHRSLTRQATGASRKMGTAEVMILVLKGWNAKVEGREVEGLVVRKETVVPQILIPE